VVHEAGKVLEVPPDGVEVLGGTHDCDRSHGVDPMLEEAVGLGVVMVRRHGVLLPQSTLCSSALNGK